MARPGAAWWPLAAAALACLASHQLARAQAPAAAAAAAAVNKGSPPPPPPPPPPPATTTTGVASRDFPLVLTTNKDNRTFAKRQQAGQLEAAEITETFAGAGQDSGNFSQLPAGSQPQPAQEVSPPQLQLGSDKQALAEQSTLLMGPSSSSSSAGADQAQTDLCRNFSIGTQHDNGGTFTTPNYPNPYPTNIVCTKVIEAPPGHYIVLEFRDDFSIEEAGLDCDNDKIEIRDGRYGYSKVLARFCGSRFPTEVSSSDQSMWLRFVSDASIAHKGFKAVYKFEKQKIIKPNPPYECRFNVTSLVTSFPTLNGTDNRTGIHSGVIRNADIPDKLIEYTKNYNASLECIWNITVKPGWKIYLTFLIYELSKPNDCDSNFIEIYEENLTEENQTVKFCGTRTEPQQSKSNVFNIRHHASPNANGSKFEIIYTAFREKGPEGCESREFDCDDGTCIHDSLKCDGQYNCKYHYDENSEPGPCQGYVEGTFFETEHMVIILIVFLTLVGGMCASIVVSCWGKIQERRRRKLEYHLRKSRETSMSGQLNNVDQMIYGSSNGPTNSSSKQGLIASIGASENFGQQQTASSKYGSDSDAEPGSGPRRFPGAASSGNVLLHQQQQQQHLHEQQPHFMAATQYGAHPTLMNNVLASAGANYGPLTGANQSVGPNSSLGVKLSELAHGDELMMNLKGGSRLNYMGGAGVGQQQLLKGVEGDLQHSSQLPGQNLSSKQLSHHLANQSTNKQQSVPDISINNQLKSMLSMQSNAIVNSHHQIAAANEQAKQSATQKQQMLNLSLATRNQQPLGHQQHQQHQQPNQFFSSIYRPYGQAATTTTTNTNTNNNSNNNNNTTTNTNSNGTSLGTGNSATLHDYAGAPLRHQQNVAGAGVDSYPGGIFARPTTTNQGIPLSSIKYNIITAGGSQHQQQQLTAGHRPNLAQVDSSGQSINYDTTPGSQFSANVSNDLQRASTLSNSMHQSIYKNPQQRAQNLQAIYELYPRNQPLNANNLSSSITCCNLTGSCLNETPLLDDLLVASNQHQHQQHLQHQHQQLHQSALHQPQRFHYPQNARIYALRSATLDPRRFNPAMPRSISAHQLSKLHTQQPAIAPKLKQAKPQQQPPHQQLHFQTQSQQTPHQLPYKSISDAGKAASARHHQPPDHSLSYPHACTGPHGELRDESPALPPPPPPPNLVHQRTGARPDAVGAEVVGPAGFSHIDNRRAAFKVSRLDSSQLTSDNLQDRELVMNSLLLGSMQFDEQSTESDGTFGMMMSQGPTAAIGAGPKPAILNMVNCPIGASNQQQALWAQQQASFALNPRGPNFSAQKHLQSTVNHHLGACNVIQQLRQQQLGQPIDQNLLCNCGAIERVNQIYQKHLTSSSREYDDSDDAACLVQQQQQHRAGELGATFGGPNHHAQFSPNPSHSSVNPQKQRRATCFKQRSSEMTADEEEEEDDDDEEFYQEEEDEEEVSSDVGLYQGASAEQPVPPLEYRARSVIRNEELLRDEPSQNFTGSHTSISCQSCTCGSQLRLNRLNTDEDTELQQPQAAFGAPLQDRSNLSSRAGKSELSSSENQQASSNHNGGQQRTPKKVLEGSENNAKQSSRLTGSKENCDTTTKATVGSKMN